MLGLSHVRSMSAERLDGKITEWFRSVGAGNVEAAVERMSEK